MNGQQAYLGTLIDHINYVQEAGKTLNVPEDRLRVHDASKFSPEEFEPYANYFWNRDGTPRTTRDDDLAIEYEFTIAWLHHLQHNDHHWQHWIFPKGYSNKLLVKDGLMTEGGVVWMPEHCILEMVADWLGASRVYTGSWNMTEWLRKNMERIVLHPLTALSVKECLLNYDYNMYKNVMKLDFKKG